MQKTQIAKENIANLFKQAKESYLEHPERSHRYVQIARKIANKARISIPKPYKYQYCKKCLHFLFPGKNLRKRTNNGKIILTCLDCKQIRRLMLKR